jgi:hypothetical protein
MPIMKLFAAGSATELSPEFYLELGVWDLGPSGALGVRALEFLLIGHRSESVRAVFKYASIFATTSGFLSATFCFSPMSVLRL